VASDDMGFDTGEVFCDDGAELSLEVGRAKRFVYGRCFRRDFIFGFGSSDIHWFFDVGLLYAEDIVGEVLCECDEEWEVGMVFILAEEFFQNG
jgi:hypothetical protein